MEASRTTCSAQSTRNVDHVESLDSEAPSQKPTSKRPRKRKRTAMEEEEQHLLTPWVHQLVTTHESFEQRLHHEIVAYLSYIIPTPQEKIARHRVFIAIATAIKARFPKAKVNIFGSVVHDLCLPDSDLDICVRLQEVLNPDTLRRSLFQFSHVLKDAGITSDVGVNRWAKVPIISFRTIPDLACFKVDIGIGNVDGVHAIDIINGYLTRMPALRPLIMVVKAFLSQRKLNSAANSGLSSYCLTCMAISFLQKLNPTERPVDCIEKPLETELLGALVVDFFFYYGNTFPYDTSYISVNEGKLLLKSSAPWIQTTVPQRLAIQCLVQPDNDIAKSAGRIEAVKAAFREAHTTLTGIHSSSETSNILGNIIAFSQPTIDRREHVRNVVDSGRLSAALTTRVLQWKNEFGARGNYPAGRSRLSGSELSYVPRRSPEKRQRLQY